MEHDFLPAVWAEDPAPAGVDSCAGCELCRQRTRVIWGEGNPEADLIVILDNPGCREDRDGNAFVCGTRQTLQLAANLVGLGEKDLYITYILKCRPARKYDKETARKTCLAYLERQLRAHPYKAALCLGDTAVRAFFADPETSVKRTRGAWRQIRGLPTRTSYHPLAVRRRPNLLGLFLEDWEQAAQKLREEPGPDEKPT